MECKKCYSDEVIKYGHSAKWQQRILCKSCYTTKIPESKTANYDILFIKQVLHTYLHTKSTARKTIYTYHISSKTLIKRKKLYNTTNCQFCH